MAITSALNIGAQGIQGGMQRLQGHASDVARLNIDSQQGLQPAADGVDALSERQRPSLPSSMVGQIEASHLVKSNARTVEVASDTLGTLLDVKA
ncbi:MAG: hypothetical protein LAT62_14295 [Natronospirillum sp.]|uniref:hypothetical protein n=1 Tax=Natronospirillum sp. TaxID=2812955 RepID=UPI0025DC6147|nr:hypothetical protein [Natronospirillum sp.]MCH8553104.1 hypothetical protein [Natronospirillum sp.]